MIEGSKYSMYVCMYVHTPVHIIAYIEPCLGMTVDLEGAEKYILFS